MVRTCGHRRDQQNEVMDTLNLHIKDSCNTAGSLIALSMHSVRLSEEDCNNTHTAAATPGRIDQQMSLHWHVLRRSAWQEQQPWVPCTGQCFPSALC